MNPLKFNILTVTLAVGSTILVGQTVRPPDNSQASVRLVPSHRTQVVNGYQSLTAQVSHSNIQDVTFSVVSGSGSIVGTGNTVAVTASEPGDVTVLVTSKANGSSAQATIHFAPAPLPNTSHPRILFTSADLPRLRALYVSTNPIYQNGFRVAVQGAVNNTNAHWAWSYRGGNGQPDAFWQSKDTGGPSFQTASQYYTEEYMGVFAVASLLEPNPATRSQYASMARDMLLWLMNQENGDLQAGVPFRAPSFPVGDRMRAHGWAYAVTIDCVHNILTASDFALAGQVFHRWAKAQSTSGVTSSQFPQPVGVTDNISILTNKSAPLRWALNNHSIGAGSVLLFESVALDENDDPTIGYCAGGRDTICSDGNANSMHAYIKAFTGAWLLRQFAEYEDKGIVSAAYTKWLHTPVSPIGIGESAGGYSLEGTEYESSIGQVHLDMMVLHNAGLDDPAIYGPQVSLRTSTYFDLFLQSTMAKISPTPELEHTSYWGNINVYEFMNFADDLRFYMIAQSDSPLFNMIAADDNAAGDRTRSAQMQWFPDHGVCCSDTLANLYRNAGANAWANSDGLQAISYLLASEPSNPAVDPRPTLPLDYTAQWGRYLGRTQWTAHQSSWVGYKCSFITIDHQAGDCGLFEWNRNGEWLVKEQVAYDLVYYTAFKPDHHNVMGIQNTTLPLTGITYLHVTNQTGGQYWNVNNGDPTTLISYGPGYMSAFSDSTNLYNHPSYWTPSMNAMAVTHASRSMLWLKPDLLIYYDRAVTNRAGLFKREHLQTAGAMANNGNLTTSVLPSGQTLYIQTLLPAANLAFTVAPADAVGSDGDPTKMQLTIDATDSPASIRYLNVLEATDAGVSMVPAVAFHSSDAGSLVGGAFGNVPTASLKPTASSATGTGTTPGIVPPPPPGVKPPPGIPPPPPPPSGNAFDGVVVGNVAALFINTPGPFTTTSYKVPASVNQQYVTGLAPNTAYSVCTTRTPSPKGDQLSMKVSVSPAIGCATVPSDQSGTLAFQSE